MSELWDIYDKNRKKTGKVVERGKYEFKEDEYHIVVEGIIINSKKQILITKRSANKKFGLMWEFNGGSVLSGETSLDGIIRELNEELGICLSKKEAVFFKSIKRNNSISDFKDIWLFKKDMDIKDIVFQDGEAIEAKWVEFEEFERMYKDKEIVPTINFKKEDYEKALKIQQRDSYKYIGNIVDVKIDRSLNTKHPKHGFVYLLNYGYVPNTVSGDGEELDCYVLGVDKPIEKFKGRCVAVIHRINDDDDKLVIVPEGKDYTDNEIRKLTNFQEKYFESEIIR